MLRQESLNQPTGQHRQQPTEINRNSPESKRRNKASKQLYRRVSHRVHELKNHHEKSARTEPGIENTNPIEDKSHPEYRDIDTEQRSKDRADGEQYRHDEARVKLAREERGVDFTRGLSGFSAHNDVFGREQEDFA